MAEIKDGGPAFPTDYTTDTWRLEKVNTGMSLRDYFAAKALAGGLCFHQEDGGWRDPEEAAQFAYKFADAMLTERAKERK